MEGVPSAHEGRDPTLLLRVGDDVQGEGGLARRLGAVQLGDAAAWDPPHSEREVEQERARGDDEDLSTLCGLFAQFHDRALAIALDDVGDRRVEGLLFFLFQCLELPPRSLWRVFYVVGLRSTSS